MLRDYFKNAIDVGHHVVIPKAKHFEALSIKPGIALCITRTFDMLTAVEFDDQPGPVANEICNIGPDRDLTSKRYPVETMRTQA